MPCCLQLSSCTGAFRRRIQSNLPPLLFRSSLFRLNGWLSLCFGPGNRQQRWRYTTSGPVQESSPCVCNGTVYVGDMDGIFHAVEASTGKARWTFKSGAEIKSSPNCFGNRVYFGSYDQNLYCLSADAGALIWKFTTGGPVHCTPAIDKRVPCTDPVREAAALLDSGKILRYGASGGSTLPALRSPRANSKHGSAGSSSRSR